jgi:geranyl-CoA carboxylase alpha subunit
MNGVVVEVLVSEGDSVEAGQTLLTLESMKMQHQLTAAISGRVEAVMAAAGDQVKPRQVLVRLTQKETEGAET